MLIDTHAHVNFNVYKDDFDEVIQRALQNDIWMINVGSQYDTSKRAIEIAGKYEHGVYAAIGLHPIHLGPSKFVDEEEVKFKTREEEFDPEEYRELAKKITKGDERHIDLLHDILISFETNDKWNNLNTKEEQMYFLTRAITNQFYSNNSKFQRTYRKFNAEAIDIPHPIDVPYQDRPSIEWVNNLLETELQKTQRTTSLLEKLV